MVLIYRAEIEAGGDSNLTALHLAAWFGKEAVAAQLLQAGASVSAVTDDGSTPLHWAAYNGETSIANLLLQANASSTAVNKYGDTTAQYAKHCGHGDPRGDAARVRASRSLKVRADSAGNPSTLYAAKLF